MSKKNESLGKTIGVVLALCLVCSILVAGSAVALKPMQEKNAALAMQRNILNAAGILSRGWIFLRCMTSVLTHWLSVLKTIKSCKIKTQDLDNRKAANDPEPAQSLIKVKISLVWAPWKT